jgi:hypothetical protein
MERELTEDICVDGAGGAAMEGVWSESIQTEEPISTALAPEDYIVTRPMKPLRGSTRFKETVSLPAGFLFSEHSSIRGNTQGNSHVEEEEDWSLELPNAVGA